MRAFPKLAAVAALGLGLTTIGATAASAAVVCNAENVCWHARGHYDYRPEWNLAVHPDNWRWGAHDRYHWREHHGRGYWSHGRWVRF